MLKKMSDTVLNISEFINKLNIKVMKNLLRLTYDKRKKHLQSLGINTKAY